MDGVDQDHHKGGPERKTCSDPDAFWGHRSAVSTRAVGSFYGYKLHQAVCAETGLPLAWRAERAKAQESSFAVLLLDALKARGSGPRSPSWTWATTSPPLRETPAVKAGKHRPPTCEHGESTFAGSDAKRQAAQVALPDR